MIYKKLKKAVVYFLGFVGFLVAIFVLGLLWPLDKIEALVTRDPILITGVSIVDVRVGELVENQNVLIENHRITRIGNLQEISAPSNAIKIDGYNRFLMPSLWDMHTHVYKISPLLDMPLYIAYGVNNVRDMVSCPKAGDPFIACPEDFVRWTQAAKDGQLVGPRIQGTSSFLLNGPGIHDYVKNLPEFFGAANPEQAREFVRYYAGKVDALKVYDYIPREAYFALVDEAKKWDMDVVGHRPHAVSALDAARNQKSIEHARFILHESFAGSAALRDAVAKGGWKEDRRAMLDGHDPALAEEIFAAMKASGTWYVPTHLTRRVDAYAEHPLVLEDPLLRYVHPLLHWQWLEDVNKVVSENPSAEARETYREFYRKGLELTGAAHRAGVKILVGTDYIVAGATVHDEMQQLIMAGLAPADVLRAATLAPAEYFGLEKEYGLVAEGMMADLILLNKNPLQDIRNTLSIEAVIFNGNLYGRDKLDEISAKVEARAKSWTLACKILWQFIKNPAAY